MPEKLNGYNQAVDRVGFRELRVEGLGFRVQGLGWRVSRGF